MVEISGQLDHWGVLLVLEEEFPIIYIYIRHKINMLFPIVFVSEKKWVVR